MRLLHQFTSSTAFTVTDGTEVQRTWKGSVIDLAFDHSFLLHSILAFSALHLAYIHPQDKAVYVNVAARHQDKALSEAHPAIADLSIHNCEALLAFSLLTVCYIPASKDTLSGAADAAATQFRPLLDWLKLIRGVVSVVERGRRWIRMGSLAIWLQYFSPDLARSTPLNDISLQEDHRLRCLEKVWNCVSSGGVADCTHDDARLEAALCNEALAQLRGAFSLADVAFSSHSKDSSSGIRAVQENSNGEGCPSVVAASLVWLYEISDGFLHMIIAQRPAALILLLHNFILVKRLGGERCWWAPLLAAQVADAVTPLITPEYQDFILWPIEEIRGAGVRPNTIQ
ncbi:hypothetical protein SLS57_011097 [Botryosphaeria dothidea]